MYINKFDTPAVRVLLFIRVKFYKTFNIIQSDFMRISVFKSLIYYEKEPCFFLVLSLSLFFLLLCNLSGFNRFKYILYI